MRMVHRAACLALLALLAGAAALETAVPPEDTTPEPQQLPLTRSIPQSIAEGLSALWHGSGAKAGPLSDTASLAAAAAGLDIPNAAAAEYSPRASSAPGSAPGFKFGKIANGKIANYPAELRRLTRSSSEKARAALADAETWARGPWPASSAAGRYMWQRSRDTASWWQDEGIDMLRDPWSSAGKVLRASARQTRLAAREFWAIFGPGGKLHPTALFESQVHLAIEAALVVMLVVGLLQRSYRPGAPVAERLTEKEVQELCEEWQPEPLAGPIMAARADATPPVVSSDVGPYIVADGRRVLNLASTNFLGIAGDPEIREICRNTITKYGVGACGPRGFYGTIDVHLKLEDDLARFMGTQEAILYSFDLSTVPSILPAFANKRDLIICDEAACFPVQNGALLSRAKVLYFKHNDVVDLERVLQSVAAEDARKKRPLNRRYIVVEGIYANTGDVAPLAEIARLKHKYKYRLVVDESLALGVLGAHGRGAAEAAGLQPKDVDIISASLSNSLGSIGGFCAGVREITDHQRLSGLGYCFSAALPPYLATAATGAIDKIGREGAQLAAACTANARRLRGLLSDMPGLTLVGGKADLDSPQLHLRLAQPRASHDESEGVLGAIAAEALKRDAVLVSVHRYAANDRCAAQGARPLGPSLQVSVTAAHEGGDLDKAAAALRCAAQRVLQPRRSGLTTRSSATL